ncbi:MAG: hypothetical protein SVC26_06390, partial [Pseudomonadota bacterium]|nr:hypothetical protein [Pseudomonadota bacterium]
NVILNGAQYGDGYDEYRITNVNLWAKNGDLNIVARINLEADLDIVPAYSLDYIGGESNVSPNKKSAFADVGYAPILNADGVEISDADYNFDDPTTAPNHTGLAIRGFKADLALGRVFYQPLTLGIASRRGDLKVELAQIPGGFVCQPTDPSCTAADTVSIDDPINALAKDFYSDPLSKSQVSWDHAYLNGEYIGGAEINDLRIHYLNLTTCASATDVASCN